jgi:hypothetical protein
VEVAVAAAAAKRRQRQNLLSRRRPSSMPADEGIRLSFGDGVVRASV